MFQPLYNKFTADKQRALYQTDTQLLSWTAVAVGTTAPMCAESSPHCNKNGRPLRPLWER